MRKTKWRLTTLIFFCLAFSGCDTKHDTVLRTLTGKNISPAKQITYLFRGHNLFIDSVKTMLL